MLAKANLLNKLFAVKSIPPPRLFLIQTFYCILLLLVFFTKENFLIKSQCSLQNNFIGQQIRNNSSGQCGLYY